MKKNPYLLIGKINIVKMAIFQICVNIFNFVFERCGV